MGSNVLYAYSRGIRKQTAGKAQPRDGGLAVCATPNTPDKFRPKGIINGAAKAPRGIETE